MGPYTSVRSNIRTKYSRFLTADSQGMYSFSFRRKRVEFRASVTLTSLALRKTEFGGGKCDRSVFNIHVCYKSVTYRNFIWCIYQLQPSLPCQIKCIVNKLSSVHRWDPLKERDVAHIKHTLISIVKTTGLILFCTYHKTTIKQKWRLELQHRNAEEVLSML